MTVTDLLKRVAHRLSFDPPKQDLLTTVQVVINAIDDRLSLLNSNLLRQQYEDAITAGTDTVALPSRLLKIPYHPSIVDSEGRKTQLLTLPEGKRYEFNQQGRPKYYEVVGQEVVLYPTPDEDVTLKYIAMTRNEVSAMDDALPYNGAFDDAITDMVVKYGAQPVAAESDPMLEHLVRQKVDRVAVWRSHKNLSYRMFV